MAQGKDYLEGFQSSASRDKYNTLAPSVIEKGYYHVAPQQGTSLTTDNTITFHFEVPRGYVYR